VWTKPPAELTKAPVPADHPVDEVVGELHRPSFLNLAVAAQRPFSTKDRDRDPVGRCRRLVHLGALSGAAELERAGLT
jgi:hypothetical protein